MERDENQLNFHVGGSIQTRLDFPRGREGGFDGRMGGRGPDSNSDFPSVSIVADDLEVRTGRGDENSVPFLRGGLACFNFFTCGAHKARISPRGPHTMGRQNALWPVRADSRQVLLTSIIEEV